MAERLLHVALQGREEPLGAPSVEIHFVVGRAREEAQVLVVDQQPTVAHQRDLEKWQWFHNGSLGCPT